MIFRQAQISDIPQMQIVRNSVQENKLSNPDLVRYEHYVEYLTQRGQGWVCTENDVVVGFSVISIADCNVWALFVHPDFEKRGIGLQLHALMLDWYFGETDKTVWLSTETNSRAEYFYTRAGWKNVGRYGNNEIKFEMSYQSWKK